MRGCTPALENLDPEPDSDPDLYGGPPGSPRRLRSIPVISGAESGTPREFRRNLEKWRGISEGWGPSGGTDRPLPGGRGAAPGYGADLAALPPVRAEEHLGLARFIVRRTVARPDPDDLANAFLGLVGAAAAWNAGKRPCPWASFAANQVRWTVLCRFRPGACVPRAAEVPLFLEAPDDDEAEIERPEMAREDPGFARAEDAVDGAGLLASLGPIERQVLERRYGFRGEPSTRERIGAEMGLSTGRVAGLEARALAKLRKKVRRRTFTIPLDGPGAERLR